MLSQYCAHLASFNPLRFFGLSLGYAGALWSQSPTAEPVRVTWHRGQSPGADPERREGPTRRGKGRLGGGGAAQVPGIPYRAALWRPSLQPTGPGPGPAPRLPVRVLASDLCARQGPRSWGPAPHLTPSFQTQRSPGPALANRLRKVECASRTSAPTPSERKS